MDYNYFIEKYNYYSERVVDNYEFRLAEYIMIDICEASESDYFIDFYNESFYLEELHENLNNTIDVFIQEQEISNSYDDETRNLLIEFVLLLKIVDYKILALPPEIRSEMEIMQNKTKLKDEYGQILINGNLKNQKIIVDKLYDLLINATLISAKKLDFRNHFFIKSNEEKLKWLGTQAELANLFSLLYSAKLIKEKNIYKLAVEHFTDKNSKPYNNRRLSSAVSGYIDSSKLDEQIKGLKQVLD